MIRISGLLRGLAMSMVLGAFAVAALPLASFARDGFVRELGQDGAWPEKIFRVSGRKKHGHDEDCGEDDDREGEDDDEGEEEGRRCGMRGAPRAALPAQSATPPRNGLFTSGTAPVAVTR